MNINKSKLFGYLPFIVLGSVGAYFLIDYLREKAAINPNASPQPSPVIPTKDNPVASGGSGSFPLKKGMTNDYIKQLQSVLDVTPQSGYFGSITLAALQEQTGKTQIDSLDDLNATIATIFQNDSPLSIQKTNKSTSIISTYNNLFQTYNLYPAGATTIPNKLYFGADTSLYSTDDSGQQYVMYISKGKTLSLNDYVPTDTDNQGNLSLVCNTGSNAGKWFVDPTNITIQ